VIADVVVLPECTFATDQQFAPIKGLLFFVLNPKNNQGILRNLRICG